MRAIAVTACLAIAVAMPVGSTDFLGVELCAERVDTGIILPADSPLSLESVEVGRHGGLVMLLHSRSGQVLEQVDDLMMSFTGNRGTGDERKLEWSGNQITGFAQVIKKGYVALAVTAADDCTPEPEAAAAAEPEEPQAAPASAAPSTAESAAAATVAATTVDEATTVADTTEAVEDFVLKGRLKHSAAEDGWLDIMGVVINRSGTSYAVASFDLSFYDDSGELICVDTISVNQLRDGQERAFRGSIRCADYVPEKVASWKLQFAGGH